MKRKTKHRLIEVVICLLIATAGVILLLPTKPTSSYQPPSKGDTNPLTEEEMMGFWHEHLAPCFTNTLPTHRFRIPELQTRYDHLTEKIVQRYGRIHDFFLLMMYALGGPNSIFAGCKVENGVPRIALFLPAGIDLYRKQKVLGRTERECEIFAVFSLLHELEHLAYTEVGVPKTSFERVIAAEKVAWANTCEYAMRPMVEKHHFRLLGSELLYYSSWIAVGRNADDPRWAQFIGAQYASTQ